jgi:hypothetical protein
MTTEPLLPDSWNSQDFPVLRAVVEKFASAGRGVFVERAEIQQVTGLTGEEISSALRNLERGEFVSLSWTFGGPSVDDITERALRATGTWPTPESTLDRMVAALEAIAGSSTTPEHDRETADRFAQWLKADPASGLAVSRAALTGELPGATP